MRESALHIAAENGHLEVVQCLLKAGVDVNEKDSLDETALNFAAAKGHLRVVQYLLQQPNINLTQDNTYDHWTVLHDIAKNGHTEIMDLMRHLGMGVNVNAKGKFGRTPLLMAIQNGHLDTVKSLLQYPGIDINLGNSQ